jgi:hypothetical protein
MYRIQEFINNNCFYHLTCISNKESILESGLKSSKAGIYVFRYNHEEVLNAIFQHYLMDKCIVHSLEEKALLIKIDPVNHEIVKEQIRVDHATDSPVLKIQNIIRKEVIHVSEAEIIDVTVNTANYNSEEIKRLMNDHPNSITMYEPEATEYNYVVDYESIPLRSHWQKKT